VLHSTVEPTLEGSIRVLRDREVSYHFLIDRNGDIVQCVDPTFAAYHAGKSLGPQGEGVNEYSIGISFVNLNDGADPYTEEQQEAAKVLVVNMVLQFRRLKFLTSHAVISPDRKTDPVGYPIAELAAFADLEYWTGE